MPQDYSNLKKALSGILEDTKKKKADEEIIRKQRNEEDRAGILSSLGTDLGGVLQPYIEQLQNSSKMSAEEMSRIIAQSVKIDAPAVDTAPLQQAIFDAISKVRIPKSDVIVNFDTTKIRVPSVNMPEEMTIKGWVNLMGYDRGLLSNPLPVQLRDSEGKPVNLGSLNQVIGGEGGGVRIMKISSLGQSAFAEILNPDGRVRVELPAGATGLTDIELRASSVPVEQVSGSIWSVYVAGSNGTVGVVTIDPDGNPTYASATAGLTDTELRASSVPVEQVSGSIWSTYLTGSFSSTMANDVVNSDNRIRVSVETGGSSLTDAELRASSVPTEQVSGSVWSVYVTGGGGATSVAILNGDGTYRDTFPVQGTVAVSGITNTVGANILDSSGVGYSGSNPLPTTLATALDQTIDSISANQVSGANFSVYVTGSSGSVSASIIDSSGIGYSGSNPVPVTLISGALTSTIAVGSVVSDVADDGSAPIKTGGIARQANPTAVSGGDSVSFSADDLGRQLVRPVQVRDLIATAYVSKATGSTFGTETTLLGATAGKMFDLIYVMGTNDSDVAISCDIRGVTAGGVLMTIRIPANGTAGIATPVPLPQTSADTGNAWTIDLPDVTGTNVNISALFSQEI